MKHEQEEMKQEHMEYQMKRMRGSSQKVSEGKIVRVSNHWAEMQKEWDAEAMVYFEKCFPLRPGKNVLGVFWEQQKVRVNRWWVDK